MKTLVMVVQCLLIVGLSSSWGADRPWKTKLPKVLIIGDSISIGYTPYVKQLLKGKAVVSHNRGNAGPTIRGVANIDKWLGNGKWDVIYFNWGLWDMYGWEYAKADRSPARYEQRLETLVDRLEKTGAKLIWATTTPVCPAPETTMLRRFHQRVVISPAVERQYREAALRVMKRHKIRIDDLHALMGPVRKKYALAPNNVHYTAAGYQLLARQVAHAIEETIKAESPLAKSSKP